MVDFGEKIIVESLRIPWLIWIQLLVFFLLIVLLCCFSIISDDNVNTSGDNPSSSSSSLTCSQKQTPVFQFHHMMHQVGENQSIREATNCSRGGSGVEKKGEGNCNRQLHPCNIISLAKIAFLKCLGFDSSSNAAVER